MINVLLYAEPGLGEMFLLRIFSYRAQHIPHYSFRFSPVDLLCSFGDLGSGRVVEPGMDGAFVAILLGRYHAFCGQVVTHVLCCTFNFFLSLISYVFLFLCLWIPHLSPYGNVDISLSLARRLHTMHKSILLRVTRSNLAHGSYWHRCTCTQPCLM